MKNKLLFILVVLAASNALFAQTNPIITGWLRNTTGITGRHYVAGNSIPIVDTPLANVQTVQYSASSVYVSTNGIPAYITGPFQDGNPSLATSQNGIFKFPLTPTPNTSIPTSTTGGKLGFLLMVLHFLIIEMVFLGKTQQVLCVVGQFSLLVQVMEFGIEMRLLQKKQDLIALKHIRQWGITTTIKIQVHLTPI